MLLKHPIILILFLSCFGYHSKGFAQEKEILTLPNGLRCVLHPGKQFVGQKVEVRLILEVGSWAEDHGKGEAGVAHYIEHVALAGTQHFPDDELTRFVERHGGVFGYDLNALTGYDRTIYTFSIPSRPAQVLDSTLLAATDILDNATLTSKHIERERKVIIEEIRAHSEDDPFYSLHMGIGTHKDHLPVNNIRNIGHTERKGLCNFYNKWYKPNLATLVIVGDFDPISVEDSLKRLCSQRAQTAPDPPSIVLQYPDGGKAELVSDTLYEQHSLTVSFPYLTPGDYVQRLAADMAIRVMGEILRKQCDVGLTSEIYLGQTSHLTLRICSSDESLLLQRFREAMQLLHTVRERGLCQSPELYRSFASEQLRMLNVPDNLSTPTQWQEYYEDVVFQHRPLQVGLTLTKEEEKEYRKLTQQPQLDHLIQELLSDCLRSPLLAYKRGSGGKLGVDTLKRIALAEYVATSLPTLPHSRQREHENDLPQSFGFPNALLALSEDSAMTPLSVEYIQSMGLTVAHYPNGMILVVKPTQQERIRLHYMGNQGLDVLADSIYSQYEGMVGYADMGGIVIGSDTISAETWQGILESNGLTLGSSISHNKHGYYGSAPKDQLGKLLLTVKARMLHSFIPEDAYEEVVSEEIENLGKPSILQGIIDRNPTNLVALYRDSILQSAPRVANRVTPKLMRSVTPSEICRMYTDLFSTTLGYTLVMGPIIPDSVIMVFGKTLGTMPCKEITQSYRLPQPSTHTVILEREEAEGKTITCHQLFFGSLDAGTRNSIQLKMVRELLRARLLDRLRKELGWVYSPYISLYMTETAPGILSYVFEFENSTSLKDSEELRAEVIRIWTDLGHGFPSSQIVHGLRQLFANNKSAALTPNNGRAWEEALQTAIDQGESPEEFAKYDKILNSISPQTLGEFCKMLTQNSASKTFIIK